LNITQQERDQKVKLNGDPLLYYNDVPYMVTVLSCPWNST